MAASLLRRFVRQPAVQDVRYRVGRLLGRNGRRNTRCPQIFSVGLLRGTSPLDLSPDRRVHNPVITAAAVTDMDAGFVADPFWVREGDRRWWMFFEAWNNYAHKGEIACAASADGLRWEYVRRVLREPFHLSYPFVFEHGEAFYMVPESAGAGGVRLYRAARFPERWEYIRTLLEGPYCDATVFRHDGLWWIAASSARVRQADDELHLFWAEELEGAWRPHERNPVVAGDVSAARPGGRPVWVDGRLIRFAQDCRPYYGSRLRAFEVVRLSPEEYEQAPLEPDPLLAGRGMGWNAGGMHHVDPVRLGDGHWVACTDGWVRDARFPTPAPPPAVVMTSV